MFALERTGYNIEKNRRIFDIASNGSYGILPPVDWN